MVSAMQDPYIPVHMLQKIKCCPPVETRDNVYGFGTQKNQRMSQKIKAMDEEEEEPSGGGST